jgi:hypothetical protein
MPTGLQARILEYLQKNGAQSKTALSRNLGRSKDDTTDALDHLIAQALVVENDSRYAPNLTRECVWGAGAVPRRSAPRRRRPRALRRRSPRRRNAWHAPRSCARMRVPAGCRHHEDASTRSRLEGRRRHRLPPWGGCVPRQMRPRIHPREVRSFLRHVRPSVPLREPRNVAEAFGLIEVRRCTRASVSREHAASARRFPDVDRRPGGTRVARTRAT